MAAKPTTLLLLLLVSVLVVTLVGGADGDAAVVGDRRCAPAVPSMTAQQACAAVAGTPHMLDLCLHTLAAPPAPVPIPLTRHASAAVRGALGAYAATVSAATSLLDGGAVPPSDGDGGGGGERAAFGDCMVGYGSARVAMSRLAADLQRLAAGAGGGGGGGCDGGGEGERASAAEQEEIKAGYTAGLRGMDVCARGMLRYPASPLYGRNLADRNVTLLAALLCSLVVPAPPASLPGLKKTP